FYRLAETAMPVVPDGFGLAMAAGRMGIAGLVLAPFGLRAAIRERPKAKVVGWAVLSGLLLAVHFAAWVSSLQYTSIASSTALVATNPVWVALLALLVLGQRPNRHVVIGGLVAIAGTGVIAFGDSADSNQSTALLGDGLALVGAVGSSGYYLLGRAAQHAGMSLRAYVGVTYAVAGLALLPLPALSGQSLTELPPTVYLYMALLALVPQLLGHTSFNWAVRHLDPTFVAVILLLEPVGSAVGAAILFAEYPSLTTIGGISILLAGVVVATVANRKSTT
ncbi:MAG: DMT family transporter, partial [Nannocystaceae bacterium]